MERRAARGSLGSVCGGVLNRVDIWRGPAIESVHRVHVAVVDGQGRLRASSGDPSFVTYARSAIKPIQAMPLVEDGVVSGFGMDGRELALCCASHSGERHHIETVTAMLQRIGVDENALACGPHEPFDAPSAQALRAAGREPGRIHNNCSGKHTGMIALACHHGWPVAGYERLQHPVQQRIRREVARWTGIDADEGMTAIDGCGVATFALPVESMARAFARIAAEARQAGTPAAAVIDAMASHPDYVAGTNRLCTLVSRATDGRIVAKTGAEGVYCAAVPGAELGIALKVEDGAKRAAEPALLAVLNALTLLSDDAMAGLATFAEPFIMNTCGQRVGVIRAAIRLEPRN